MAENPQSFRPTPDDLVKIEWLLRFYRTSRPEKSWNVNQLVLELIREKYNAESAMGSDG